MRVNEHTALSTSRLVLVPYEASHVPTYHEWMSDPELRAATASDDQTLEEQYDNQASWRADHDKLTFIICLPLQASADVRRVISGRADVPERMIGDINLYLYPQVDADDHDLAKDKLAQASVTAELGLMIAARQNHRRGYGRAALLMFLHYILGNWHMICAEYCKSQAIDGTVSLAYFFVKIDQDNERSVLLFESVGFSKVHERPNVFGEVELRLPVSDNAAARLRAGRSWENVEIVEYERHE